MTAAKLSVRNVSGAAAIVPETFTDQELFDACIARDERAWLELMRRYDRPLRAVVYKQLGSWLKTMPSDFREDIMGAFYLKLIEHNMAALRCFDWNKGSASFRWLSFLVRQCATDYLTAMFDHVESFAPVKEALGLADEGGVLASGRERFRGSLSRRVRRENERAAAADAKTEKKERRRRRRSLSRK